MLNKLVAKRMSPGTAAALCILAAVLLLVCSADLSLAANIKVVPSSSNAMPGQTFSIDIVVENIPPEGLGAIQFRLNVDASGSPIIAVPDTAQGRTTDISVSTPLTIGPPTSGRSGLAEFFWNGVGPYGILVMDNEELKNGSALYTFGHTSGAVPPQGSGSVARFRFAVGKDVTAKKITIALSDVMLLDAGTIFPLDSNTGAAIDLNCSAGVPNLLGLSQSEAQATLQTAGLLMGSISEIDNWSGTRALNRVLEQSYAAGTPLSCGTSVDLAINIAPSEVGGAAATDKAGDENGTVVMSWLPSSSSDTAGYRIYLLSGARSLLKEIRNSAATGVEITGLTNGQVSQLKITAFDNFGNESQGVLVPALPIDDVSPRVTIGGITEGVFYKSDVFPTITVEDANLSTKEIILNDVSYNLAPVTAEGHYTLRVAATDMSGNATAKEIHFVVDKTLPLLTVSTLSDGSWTNNELLNVSGEVTDNTGIQQCTINDAAVTINADGSFSYPVNLRDGPNTVSVIATDLAGNAASDVRTVNLDVSAPLITIIAPADNVKTKQSAIDVTGTVVEQSTVTVKVNDGNPVPALISGNGFSLTATMVYGINTIEVTATDLAGNTSAVKRTVTFDDRSPSLAITDPAQDIRTDHADMVIKGETTDLTAVTITITMDGNTYAPVVTNGEFQQPVTFTEEKTYQIYVKAVDEAGNETIVQRNVVYDVTSPAITLDPVTSPTNLAGQVLTGTMEAGATVSVTCLTATVGTVTYPTATTWTATLSNMQEGNNVITVTATDEAGNTSSPVLAAIVLSTNNSVANTGPAKLWIGLKNSDDQGTQFDLRTELYINATLISWGETRCITGVTRNALYAKEVTVPFNPISNGAYASGDILYLKVFTRIGTNPDGQKCSGPGGSHNNAVGLRMYYDAPDRPSGFGAEITPEPMKDLFLHSLGTSYFLDNVTPAGTAKYKDSSSVNYSGGNLWEEIGTWTKVLQ